MSLAVRDDRCCPGDCQIIEDVQPEAERPALRKSPMSDASPAYEELKHLLREASLLESCGAVLGWDEQTYMPPGGSAFRAEQAGLLAGMSHGLRTAPRLGELLSTLESEIPTETDSEVAANVREARRQFDRATKLPRRLVEEMSRVTSLAQQNWIQARKRSDFSLFLPWLSQIIDLKREEAAAVGSKTGIAYDALLDEYEPGMTTADVAAVFGPLREALVPLVAAIVSSPQQPQVEIVERRYPQAAQQTFVELAARKIGFDFERGRIDEAAHPFCSGFGPGDCRLTTRYDEQFFNPAFFGTLHEAGHGLYEQGLRAEAFGLPVGAACSLGIHESQSRMWENFVGRSRAFWEYFYPTAQTAFPEALGQVPLEQFHFAINDVRASLIRVEADEVTYNLHIMLRFELEQALLSGDLQAADVPAAWNEKFENYFAMTPPDDARGCLQDIHWSAGLIGYFPTYALGNMYAAQFFTAARKELGDLDACFARGEFVPLKTWLNEKIHVHGKRYRVADLVKRVTGESLSSAPLVQHLTEKFSQLYAL